ncbi:TPR repeat-containing protein ZIP4-like [Triticum dicoccoides]|uniref:TPR repeat-containing protein ZIP4-like n=1 Tax=Triticum dicoccoides TaxID=85692 RepID=UPI0018913616|nr:TPR repeat-containing protein ZIP4-like [Triticum dicoccoides]
MTISELSELKRVVDLYDAPDPSPPEKLVADFRRVLTNLGSAASSLTDALPRLQLYNLGNRLWKAVDKRANSAALALGPSARAAEAEVRQVAPELLLLAGFPVKAASFFLRAGQGWLDLGRVDLATACFDKATPLVSALATEDERRILLGLNLARARAASDAGDQSLAVALLGRSKSLASLASAPRKYTRSLAEGYLYVGEATLFAKPSDPAVVASMLLTEALDLFQKLPRPPKKKKLASPSPSSSEQKGRCLRYLALEHHKAKEHADVLFFIHASRDLIGEADEHPSMGFMALHAWLGTGNLAEAERELERLMANANASESLCVGAAEVYLASAGPEAARKVLVALVARCCAGVAAAAVRVVTRVVDCGIGSPGRARAIGELVSDERVVALFDGPANTSHRGAMHTLLWNCGFEHFNAKNYDICADLFETSMLYLSREEGSRVRRAQCLRVLAVCYLALQRLDRAHEFVNEADKVEHNAHCAFMKIKIHLQKNDEDEAIKQIKTMMGCIDFNPVFLMLTTHEAIACKAVRVAVASLTFLLGLYSAGKPMPEREVTVLRTLIELLRREQGTEDEILKYSRRAKLRMSDLGVEGFFGNGPVGARELNWFAGNSWNMGRRVAKEQKYDLSAEFFELAAEFFGGASNDEGDGNHPTLCKALIMSVTSMLKAEELNNSPLLDSDVKKGVEMLSRAGKLLPSIWPSGSVASDQAEANIFLFLHTFYSYQLLDRMDTSAHPQQLQLVKNFASSKACTPSHLLVLGKAASEGTPPNLLVAEFSLKASIKTALASHSPNYRVISAALRNLACLAGLQDLSGSKSDAVYGVYRQAYQIVVGLREGEYPCEEGQWLAVSAWNKSYLARRLNQASVGIKWMKMGLDLSRHVESMKKYIADMEQCLEYFQKMIHSEAGEHALLGKNPDEGSRQEGAPSTSMSGSMSQPVLV